MATLKDIAAALGVSVATVSNVFNGRPNVGRATRQKILRVAKQMEYRPNRAAQAMRTGRTRAIGLVLPDLTNPFFPELAQAVENTARSRGLLVCLVDSQSRPEGEADGFALLMQHAVDGIIWCPLGPRPPAQLKNLARPVVLIDPRARDMRWSIRTTAWAGGCSRSMPRAWATRAWDSCRGRRTSRVRTSDAKASSRPFRAASTSSGKYASASTAC